MMSIPRAFAAFPLVWTLALAAAPAAAVDLGTESELVSRGDATLTLADLDARMSRFSRVERGMYARDPANLARLMDRLLLNRQLANEARDMELDQDPAIRRDLELAREEILAVHRLNRLLDAGAMPDFTELARERFLSQPERYAPLESRRVQHILIGTEDREDPEAYQLAVKVRGEAMADGADFQALVEQYSEDQGKSTNKGEYVITRPGEFVPEFEAAARLAPEVGYISEPVKTRFGYHLIKLLAVETSPPTTFEDVQATLVDELRDEYIAEIRAKHSAQLKALEDRGNEELLLTLPARYGGRPEEVAAPPAGSR